MRSPRTESIGSGIRVDHRASCSRKHPRCDCPKSWHERQTNGTRKRRTGFVGTLTEAKAAKAAVTVPVQNDDEQDTPTLWEFARTRLADECAPQRQHTLDRYADAYRLRIHETLGAQPLDRLTAAVLREWCNALVKEYGDRRCAKYAYMTLHWLLNQAVSDGLISHNHASGLSFDGRAAKAVKGGAPSSSDLANKKPPLNGEQYDQLVRHVSTGRLADLVVVRVAVEGALRRAELGALRWEGFDAEERTFQICSGVTYTKTTGSVVGDTKTRKSNRNIVLSRDLCELLEAYREQAPGGGDAKHFLFPGFATGTRRLDPERPMSPYSLTNWIPRLLVEAKLVDESGKAITSLQGLRATGASLAEARGVPGAIVDAQLGHAGTSVRERHYSDLRTAPERFQFADAFERRDTFEEKVDQKLDQGVQRQSVAWHGAGLLAGFAAR